MRCAICGIRHETNTFSTLRTEREDFRVLRGQEILQDGPWDNFQGVEWVPTLVARAAPHGLVREDVYLEFRDDLIARLRDALPVDGVYMDLHGAMDVENIGDGETDLVSGVRSVVGPDVPIVASLDLHANMSPAVAEATNVLTALRTAPHIDGVETRQRALSHLVRCMKEGLRPVNVLVKIPLLLPGEFAVTTVEPARSLYARLGEIDSQRGILDASILIGCAWTDSPYTSVSVVVVAEADEGVARGHAKSLAREIWERRREFGPDVETLSVENAIRQAMEAAAGAGEGPVFISDSGDNVTAGGAGDIPLVLGTLLSAGATNAVVGGIADPDAVAVCARAGVGARVTVTLGGKLDPVNGTPLEVTGTVEHLDPPSIAVLNVDGVRAILASDRRAFARLRDFQQANLDPLAQQIVVVKQGYLFPELRTVARKTIMALSPGFTALQLDQLPYERIKRPVFPLDDSLEWCPD